MLTISWAFFGTFFFLRITDSFAQFNNPSFDLHQGVTDFHTFKEHYALTMRHFYQLVEIGNNIPLWNYLKVYDCALLAISNSC